MELAVVRGLDAEVGGLAVVAVGGQGGDDLRERGGVPAPEVDAGDPPQRLVGGVGAGRLDVGAGVVGERLGVPVGGPAAVTPVQPGLGERAGATVRRVGHERGEAGVGARGEGLGLEIGRAHV